MTKAKLTIDIDIQQVSGRWWTAKAVSNGRMGSGSGSSYYVAVTSAVRDLLKGPTMPAAKATYQIGIGGPAFTHFIRTGKRADEMFCAEREAELEDGARAYVGIYQDGSRGLERAEFLTPLK